MDSPRSRPAPKRGNTGQGQEVAACEAGSAGRLGNPIDGRSWVGSGPVRNSAGSDLSRWSGHSFARLSPGSDQNPDGDHHWSAAGSPQWRMANDIWPRGYQNETSVRMLVSSRARVPAP